MPQASPAAGRSGPPFLVVLVLFVLSGGAGLVDQICFAKYLSYVVGSTAYAVSAVLAAFMTGLALGAHLAGRFAARIQRSLFAYGVLEVVVGLAVLLSPLAFQTLTPAYVALARSSPDSIVTLSLLRWGLAFAIVVVPTTAMGATLPLLTGLVRGGKGDSPERRERRLGALYAANTLGGAVGALLAAYVLLATFGLSTTLYLAAGLSILVGIVSIVLGRNAEAPKPDADTPEGPEGTVGSLATTIAFASGALVFACEVVFTHLLALVVGNSVYAFGVILAVFLICLFVGASLAPRIHKRFGPGGLAVGLAAAGGALILTLPLWDALPLVFGPLGGKVGTFEGRELVRGLVAFGILLLPTTLMGLTFPLLLQRVAALEGAARQVGRLTAINTIGAVTGSLLTGYVILPRFGSEGSLLGVGMAFVTLALFCLSGVPTRVARATRIAVVGVTAAALLLPRWDLARLTSGVNVYFDFYNPPDEVVFVREDVHGGVTTVTRNDNVHTLYTNGKFQGNDGWEMHAQRFFGHYPCLFVDRFDRTLVVGLGTATTLGTLTAYPWKHIDVVEISPSIVEAAKTYFAVPNRSALDDPRVRMHVDDGRNYLLVNEKKYDLIGMELSSIWFAGSSSLYSQEFYRLVHQHLEPGGIFQQWVQLHHVYTEDFAVVLATLRGEFPHVALFYGGGQGILLASDDPLVADKERLRELNQLPGVRETLPSDRPLWTLMGDALLPPEGLDQFLDDVAEVGRFSKRELVSTDDNLVLEYRTPRSNVLPWAMREVLVKVLAQYRTQANLQSFWGLGAP